MAIQAAYFDVECTNLNADFGVILCAVVQPAHSKQQIVLRGDKLNADWDSRRSDDSAIAKQLADVLADYDILVAHNGRDFDLKFLRARLARWRLPPLAGCKILDPVLVARNSLKVSSNSLDRLSQFFGVKTKKTPVDGEQWNRAALDGCRKAMDYIVDHCCKDVRILIEVADVLKHYSSGFNKFGSGF